MSENQLPNPSDVKDHFDCLTHTNTVLSIAEMQIGLLLREFAKSEGNFSVIPVLPDISGGAEDKSVFEGQKDNWTHFLAQDYLISRLSHMEYLLSSASEAILDANTAKRCAKRIEYILKEDVKLKPAPLVPDVSSIDGMHRWHFAQNCYANVLSSLIVQHAYDITDALCDATDYGSFQEEFAYRKKVTFPVQMTVPLFKSIPSKEQQNEHMGVASETGCVAHDIQTDMSALYKAVQISAKYRLDLPSVLRSQQER